MVIHFTPFTFPDHSFPKGFLPTDLRAQACWYYYLLAQKHKEAVGKGPESQIILAHELWLDHHYVQQKRSIANMYGLESPDEMDKFWGYVAAEAARCGLPEPHHSYMKAAPGVVL